MLFTFGIVLYSYLLLNACHAYYFKTAASPSTSKQLLAYDTTSTLFFRQATRWLI